MKIKYLLLFVFVSSLGYSQNLVSNGDFESYSSLPTMTGLCNLSTGWDDCNGNGSPDYLHLNGSGGVQLPNSFVCTVFPHSGSAMMGIALFLTAPNFREYISTQLVSPLISGNSYLLTLYVTNGNAPFFYGGFASDHFSIALTTYKVEQPSPYLISLDAQLIYNGFLYSHTWQQLEFYFTADSAYNYITLGSFVNDQVQQLQFNDSVLSFPSAYYFIDDIELYSVSGIGESTGLNSAVVYPVPFSDKINIKTMTNDSHEFYLYDATMHEVLRNKFVGNLSMDVDKIIPGIYFYELRCKGQIRKGKILKY